MAAPGPGDRVEEEDDKDFNRGDADLDEEEDPEEEDPEEEEPEEEEQVDEEPDEEEQVDADPDEEELEEVEDGENTEEFREVAGDEETESVEEEEVDEYDDLSEEGVDGDEELQCEDEEEEEVEEDENEYEKEGVELGVDEDLQGVEKQEPGEDNTVSNVEAGANEEAVERDKPSTPPILSEKDSSDILPPESQIGYKTESGGLDDVTEDAENTNPPVFAEAEAFINENVNSSSKGEGVKEMESDYVERERNQHNMKDAEDIGFCALRSDSVGVEATKPLSTNPPVLVEAGTFEKVDCAPEGGGVKEMESNCEEKEISQDIDLYARISESKDTKIVEPHNTIGTEMIMCENAEIVLMHEGGVEDMELDSEEDVVHVSDVDGTVADSIQANIAQSSRHEVSCTTGAYALNNKTVVAESLMSSSFQGMDTMINNERKQDNGCQYMNLDLERPAPNPSSLVVTSRKQRSSPPCTQPMDKNKRPAIVCNYYAKGWCIKGNSCRFLHVKENKDNINTSQGRDLGSVNGQNQVGEGAGDGAENAFSEHVESHFLQLNDNLGHSSFESRFLNPVKPEFGSGLVASSSTISSRLRPSSNVNVAEAIDCRRSQQLFDDPLQSIADRYIKQNLSSATDTYTSRYISPVNGSSNSKVSLNSNPLDVHKILSGSIDFKATSVLFGSRFHEDLLSSHVVALNVEMYKWEPSRPFRPSYRFSIPSMASPGSMYDPLRDCMEQTSLGIESFKAERINYPSHQQYPHSASAKNHFEMDGYNGGMLDKNGHSRVTGLPVTEAEAAESSVADQGNIGSAPEGDKGSGTSRGKDISETDKTNTGSAGKKSKVIAEKIHSSGMEVDRGLDEHDQKESKTFRQFRVALIDFVKELLKPAWREGKLSKDAHNFIVKNAAKKVLSSLNNHQVPSTPELVQQYLSASRPKITKLVEAYVLKHTKT